MPAKNNNARDGAVCGICKFISDDWEEWHFVSSDDPNVHHTVHLADWNLSGACSCPDFDIKIRPLLEANVIRPHSDRARCIHIRRADKVLGYKMKRHLFALRNPNPNPTHEIQQ